MAIHPLAGTRATPSMLVDVPRLVASYYTLKPDVQVDSQKVSFGTSGHRGSSFDSPGGSSTLSIENVGGKTAKSRGRVEGDKVFAQDFATQNGTLSADGTKITWTDGLVAVWTLLKYRFTE